MSTGVAYKHFFADVNKATKLHLTSTLCRKYAQSSARDEEGEAREAVCRTLKHTSRTRDTNYLYRTSKGAVHDSSVVKNALMQSRVVSALRKDSGFFETLDGFEFPEKEQLEEALCAEFRLQTLKLNTANLEEIRRLWEIHNQESFVNAIAETLEEWSYSCVEKAIRSAGWNPSKQMIAKVKQAWQDKVSCRRHKLVTNLAIMKWYLPRGLCFCSAPEAERRRKQTMVVLVENAIALKETKTWLVVHNSSVRKLFG